MNYKPVVKDLLAVEDLSLRWILDVLFPLTEKLRPVFEQNIKLNLLHGFRIAVLFLEASTRTMGSVVAALKFLGALDWSTSKADVASAFAKEESAYRGGRTYSALGYDALFVRSKEEGFQAELARGFSKSVINCGEGIFGEHPTQALLDLLTLHRHFSRPDNLKFLFCGDLARSRVVQSNVHLLSMFSGNEINFLSPEELKISSPLREFLGSSSIKFTEHHSSLADVIDSSTDVVYMLRLQLERADKKSNAVTEYDGDSFVMSKKLFVQYNFLLMHPGPSGPEIPEDPAIELSERALFSETDVKINNQVTNGVLIRAAIALLYILPENCLQQIFNDTWWKDYINLRMKSGPFAVLLHPKNSQ